MEHERELLPLEPQADAAAAAVTGELAAGEHLLFFLLDLTAELDLDAIPDDHRQKDPPRREGV